MREPLTQIKTNNNNNNNREGEKVGGGKKVKTKKGIKVEHNTRGDTTTHKKTHQKLINLQFSTHDKINCKQKKSPTTRRKEKLKKAKKEKMENGTEQ